jgi:NAD(P)-dependent dehydrogenase (short-subunit alcohol dehydrogenase family)
VVTDARTAIVTGGSGGIGRVAAERLARDGLAVVIAYGGNRNRAEEVVAAIGAEGGDGAALRADVSNGDEVAKLFDDAEERYGGIDVVVHTAGIMELAPLAANDFMVVAPYNDQVNLVRARLDREERTRGVEVGTVDKFQGRQAAVVFFTMATSTREDMTRVADFLFSRNRLNVAISRARCLAYLVCTEGLLNTRARTVDEMRLIATLCAFVEWSQRSG